MDDSITVALSWKMKLKGLVEIETFSNSGAFFKRATDDYNFILSLDMIVTDFWFSAEDPFNGRLFAAELRKMGYERPILLASNGDFNETDLKPDFTGIVDKDLDIPQLMNILSATAQTDPS